MSELIPDWQGMPELLPDGHINPARRRAEARWQEQERARLEIAARVGRFAGSPEQAREDARTMARQIVEECRQRAAEQRKKNQ